MRLVFALYVSIVALGLICGIAVSVTTNATPTLAQAPVGRVQAKASKPAYAPAAATIR